MLHTKEITDYLIPGLLRLDNGHRLQKQSQAHRKGAEQAIVLHGK